MPTEQQLHHSMGPNIGFACGAGSQQTTPAPAACEQLIRVLKEVATVLEGLDQIEELITDLKQMRPLPASHYPARYQQMRH